MMITFQHSTDQTGYLLKLNDAASEEDYVCDIIHGLRIKLLYGGSFCPIYQHSGGPMKPFKDKTQSKGGSHIST